MALRLVEGIINDLHRSSLSTFRETEWRDVAGLDDLFTSESLKTLQGKYFDQRVRILQGAGNASAQL